MTHCVRPDGQRLATTPTLGMTLRGCIEDALGRATPRKAEAFRLYCGIGCEPHTLEAVGAHLDVTRERARQLRDSVWTKAVERHPEVLSAYGRLAEELEGRSAPLTAADMAFSDTWFAGMENAPGLLDYVLDKASGGDLHSWTLDGKVIISRCKREKWLAIRSAAKELLEGASARNLTKGQAWAELEQQTRILNAGELTGTLWESIVGCPLDDPDELLRTIGTSRAARVRGILRAAAEPLTLADIARQLGEEDRLAGDGYGYANRLRGDIRLAGGLLFDRSLYGTEAHLRHPESAINEIVSMVETLMLESDLGRQWHADEILTLLQMECPQLVVHLNKYVLSLMLRRSSRLSYRNRLVWSVRDGEGSSSGRLDVAELCESALDANGGPMTGTELRTAVEKLRGINGTFLLVPKGRLVRVGVGRWGLIDRDIGISPEQVTYVMDELVGVLHARQVGLHLSELQDALYARIADTVGQLDDGRIWGLAQRDARLTCTHGMLVGLAEWESVRRLSNIEAAERLRADGRDNLPSEEAHALLEAHTLRVVPRNALSILMGGAGYVFDGDSRTYRLAAFDTEDDAQG